MAVTPAERAKKRHEHKHGRKHHRDPKEIARREHARGVSAYGNVVAAVPQSGHLSPDQFVGFPGGFSTDAGNYTGVQAIDGAAGNGGAGGTASGDSGGGTA
jgi:hypothetical protein